MPIDNRIVTSPHLKDVDDPFKERHDIPATQAVIQQLLAGGTPDWVKFPHDFKNLVREEKAAHKENSDRMAEQYKWDDQDILTNEAARKVNVMHTAAFVQKLKDNGVKCFTTQAIRDPNAAVSQQFNQQAGLWAIPPSRQDKARYITFLQVPAMSEWDVLRLDRHGIPSGLDYRGWRSVLVELVKKDIMSEAEIHLIFGVPSPSALSSRYFLSLWEKRNGQKYVDPEEVKD